MNRKDFQELTRIRIREARHLLQGGQFDGAYYLAGYAVECALKACIAKKTRRHEWPEKAFVDKIHTHKLGELVKAVGLENDLDQEMRNANFAANWATVKEWSEQSRYRRWTEVQAQDLYNAVTNRYHGVLRWIKQYW